MRADNTRYIQQAAQQRREVTLTRATTALDEARASGEAISIQAFCRRAQVSRSWLYQQPELLSALAQLRPEPGRSPTLPVRERASERSTRVRLHAALERNQELTEENQRLRRQLAHPLGELRRAPVPESLPPAADPSTTRR